MSLHTQRGDVTIIVAFILVIMITSAAVVLQSVLSQQLRLSQDVVTTEQALYAANTGFEHALYIRVRSQEDSNVRGEIEYPTGVATYTAQSFLSDNGDVCTISQGTLRGLVRKLAVGDSTCTFE